MRLSLPTAVGVLSGYAYCKGTPLSVSTVVPFLGAATIFNTFYVLSAAKPPRPQYAAIGSAFVIGSVYGFGWLAGRAFADGVKKVSCSNVNDT
jgi:hypothetical protein